ncbi:MAG: HNH endonuclease, partial [Dehalococcoidia bacterium]|nr:HNH endonuclease [Dehalococcoidia bacterium]
MTAATLRPKVLRRGEGGTDDHCVPWRISNLSMLDGCRYCGSPAEAWDHVYPRAQGGGDDYANLVPCCSRCNGLKGNRTEAHLARRLTDLGLSLGPAGEVPQEIAGWARFVPGRGFLQFDAANHELVIRDLPTFLAH